MPPGERAVDVQRFSRGAVALDLLHGAQCTEVVEAVGELDQQDARIVLHRQQQFSQRGEPLESLAIGVLFGGKDAGLRPRAAVVALRLDFGELGDAFDDGAHRGAECFLNCRGAGLGVFDGVVEQGGGDAMGIEGQFGDVASNRQWVEDIRFARLPLHPAVLLLGEGEGAAHHIKVGGWHVVGAEFQQRAQGGLDGGVVRRVHVVISMQLSWKHGTHSAPRRSDRR